MDASPGRAEAQRWLVIAGKLLEARDLPAAKKFAERAIDADPLLDGPDQILAAADVLLANQSSLPSGNPDHYSILQLPRPSDLPSVKRSFRRLALLLRPPPDDSSAPTHPVFHLAFHLVSDSFSFLSDDDRRRLYDRDLVLPANHAAKQEEKNRKPSPPPPPQEDGDDDDDEEEAETFWTVCPNCFRAFEYAKEHEGWRLRCHVCRKPFHAAVLPSPPPIVPGTDMFYCSWGLFPLGFPGFSSIQVPPGTPSVPSLPSYAAKNGEHNAVTRTSARLRATRERPGRTPAAEAQRKAPRKVMAKRPRRGQAGGDGGGGVEREVEDGESGRGGVGGGGGGGFDMNDSFGVDLDHSSAVLGNLANLPFLKDDEIAIMR